MRVLESSQLTVMTKRKHRLRKQKRDDRYNDSSDETTAGEGIPGKSCEHISKSVVLSNVKKALKQATLGECLTCKKDGGKSKDKSSAEETTSADALVPDDIEITIWCCLQCGQQGCDRNSPGQHALKHFQTAHSSPHSVVVNLNLWAVWCYECDDDVTFDSNRKLTECIEFIKKQAGVTKVDRPSSGKKKDKEIEIAEKEKQNVTGKSSGTVLLKAKGLNNLGNTCFFNAVMQSMNQTHVLDVLMTELSRKGVTMTIGPTEPDTLDKNKKHEESKLTPLSVVLTEAGSLTSAMILFLKMMNEPSKGTVSPRLLFNQVCQKAPRFKGFQQQDSHELLRYLLDGMRSEEIRRVKEGILKEFGFQTTVNPKIVDEEVKEKIKDYGKCVTKTFVDSVFGGQLISTVLCEECHVPSEVYEPFLDLSLPITEAKVWPAKGIFQKCKRGGVPSSPKSPTAINDQESLSDGVTVIKKVEDEPTGPSKHQQKAAKKKAKKEAKQNKKKGKLLKLDEKKDSQSENEPHLLRDPNDADSETSIDKRELLMRKTTPPAVHSRDSSLSSGRRGSSVSPLLDDGEKTSVKEEEDGAANGLDLPPKEETGKRTKSEGAEPSSQDAPLVNGALEEEDAFDEDEEEAVEKMKKLSIGQGGGVAQIEKGEETAHTYKGEETTQMDKGGECSQPTKAEKTGDMNGCTMDDHQGDTTVNSKENHSIQEMLQNLPNGDIGQHESGDASDKCAKPDPEKPKHDVAVLEELGAVGGTDVSSSSIEIKKAMVPLGPKYQSREHECSIQSCLSQFTAQELLTGKNKFGCENCTKMKHRDSKDAKIVYTNASKQLLLHHTPPILTLHLKRFQQAGYSLRKVNRHVDFPLTLDLAPFCSENCKDVADSHNRICYSLYGVVEHSGRLQGGHYTAYVKVRQPSQRLLSFVQYIQHGKKTNKQVNMYKEQQNMADAKSEDSNNQEVAVVTQRSDQDGCHDVNGIEEEKSSSDYSRPFTDFEPPDKPTEGKWYYISDTHVTEVSESKVLNSQAYILFYERLL